MTMTDADAQNQVVLERSFDAPIDLVWKMWTDPDHFKAWYGPGGVSIPLAKMDVRVGGRRLVCMEMQSPDGLVQMWFAGEYREVSENRRLVYSEFMSDEHGNRTPAGNEATGLDHPPMTEVRVDLEDLGGRTRIVLTHVGIPADSPGATGWTMALEKLAAHVAGVSP
jgi:uncharacterized protein YndB with AHSA1/START domain